MYVIIPEEAFVSMGDFGRKVALSFNDKDEHVNR
jgi:hypothetical protein